MKGARGKMNNKQGKGRERKSYIEKRENGKYRIYERKKE